MANLRDDARTNFRPHPQKRRKGSGAGRKMFDWKLGHPWFGYAAERLVNIKSGGEGALVEQRYWSAKWGITHDWLEAQMESLFPGCGEYISESASCTTPWAKRLLNRVYKMYYNGTSARGYTHDPETRASISKEHWRNYVTGRESWFDSVTSAVQRSRSLPEWREWVT